MRVAGAATLLLHVLLLCAPAAAQEPTPAPSAIEPTPAPPVIQPTPAPPVIQPTPAPPDTLWGCTGVTSVSLNVHWPILDTDSGHDLFEIEYAPTTTPVPPTPPAPPAAYACNDGRCYQASHGVTRAMCEAACTAPAPPGPTPPTPPPTPAAATYACADSVCVPDPDGVPLATCQAVCHGIAADPAAGGGGGAASASFYPNLWPNPPEYTTQTSATPSAVVVDLQPETQYVFRARAHVPTAQSRPFGLAAGWNGFDAHPSWTCTTAAAPVGEPTMLRRVGGLRRTSVTVAWDPAPGVAPLAQLVTAWDGGNSTGHQRGWGAAPPAAADAALTVTAAAGATSAELTGLLPGRVYWVRAGGGDAVPFRTAADGVRVWETARVSSNTNLVDFLSMHDSGDIPADAGFLTVAWNYGTKGFAEAVMTLYCIESSDVAWGDYLSCDPIAKVGHQGCGCKNAVDSGYGNMPPGCKSPIPGNPGSLSYSMKHPGRMPIYHFTVPTAKEKRLGWWISTTGGECAEGAAVGDGGCTWSRHPTAATVKGRLLTANGFKPGTQTTPMSVVKRNANVTAATFAAHPARQRCCGC